jgi:hypothetical protein
MAGQRCSSILSWVHILIIHAASFGVYVRGRQSRTPAIRLRASVVARLKEHEHDIHA